MSTRVRQERCARGNLRARMSELLPLSGRLRDLLFGAVSDVAALVQDHGSEMGCLWEAMISLQVRLGLNGATKCLELYVGAEHMRAP